MLTITGTTRLLGVIGHPVEHSLSPTMHNAAIAHLNLNYVYLPLPVPPEALETALAGFQAIGVVGFSVTIPHKQAIIPLLSQVSPVAQAIGAVNTVWHTPTGWHGTNTDVTGFMAPLKSLDRDWSKVYPVVLGNGGAARAVVAGCVELGCKRVAVVGRDRTKLETFQQSWHNTPFAPVVTIHTYDDLPTLLPQTQLLINSTPVGMHPHTADSPLPPEGWPHLPPSAIVYDLIYTPRPTRFLQQAQQRGLLTLDGTEMLIQQGAAALELWLQQPVPVEIMGQALLNALDSPHSS
ncbi:shikimate dehydrogenase [Spirulina subsalsa FACHB-351]|uniref:Shikimate dehydrogenase (NADP(+)) n=1 Tax=Spirulina subsalsa FACHB-351 TaxID=234711 RepID=A0ABT3LBE8_9CYAN|nr:shikimate dehydrogenase [Spirulina subsalsa]MCW6038842.1 shikimate dehydrogenase [Spirulina subsalsa FACHB-351]